MTSRTILNSLALAALLLLFLASPAWARGGRYGAPGDRPPGNEEPAPEPEAAEAAEEPAPNEPCGPRDAGAAVMRPSAPTFAGTSGSGRRSAAGIPSVGIVDWLHWYESRRERFEDFRAWALRTETNPLFAVGPVGGGAAAPTLRVGDRTRSEIVRALLDALQREREHWIPTEAAAYVALGKVAVSRDHIAPHLAVLTGEKDAQEYIRESAVLGLGHLARPEAERRLGAALLDQVRGVLFDVLASDDFGIRTRSFAGTALGLLADQPSAREEEVGTWTAEKLLRIWTAMDLPDEVQVGILTGLSRVQPDAVSAVVRLVVEGCARKGRTWPTPSSSLVRAQSLLTLARIGDATSAPAVASLLRNPRGKSTALLQAAAMAAGILGERIPEVRRDLGRALLRTLDLGGEPGCRHLAWMALGRVLAAQAPSGDYALLADDKAGARLVAGLERAPSAERAFVALSLGVAAGPVDHTVDSGTWQAFRFDAIEALRAGITKGANAHLQAAHCVGLGLARDRHSGPQLLSLLKDLDTSPELRAYAALGLGLLGDARHGVVPALTEALGSTRSELVRMRAATALGLLGGGNAKEQEEVLNTLVTALQTTRSQRLKGQIAVTLGRIGDARAVKPLAAILAGKREAQMNRAIACAALGLVGDEQVRPLLAVTREDAHYLTGASVVKEILDLL